MAGIRKTTGARAKSRLCEQLEKDGGWQDWQVRQAEHALRIYFVNFLQRTDWQRRPQNTVVDEHGRIAGIITADDVITMLRHKD